MKGREIEKKENRNEKKRKKENKTRQQQNEGTSKVLQTERKLKSKRINWGFHIRFILIKVYENHEISLKIQI